MYTIHISIYTHISQPAVWYFAALILQTLVQNTWPLDNKIELEICIINERTRRIEQRAQGFYAQQLV